MTRRPATPIEDLDRFLEAAGPAFEVREEATVQAGIERLPVYSIALGNPAAELPAVGYFGGVHGLERIGCEVVIAFLRSLQKRLEWDAGLHQKLESLRMVLVPIVNPGGLRLGTRANPAGVDLMRNAPIDATEPVPFLVGGQRRSARLPWYRGAAEAPMEPEATALCEVVERELLGRRFSLALDCHSGFGVRDRLWFPFACSTRPIRHLPEMHALASLYGGSYAHHRYLIEPQSRQYCAHGDLWDFLYLRACEDPERIFLPVTLEMGSWSWVKKNPRQLFSRLGIFNPQIEHRQHRVLRRHVGLMEFLARAARSADRWLPVGAVREGHQFEAWRRWYGEAG